MTTQTPIPSRFGQHSVRLPDSGRNTDPAIQHPADPSEIRGVEAAIGIGGRPRARTHRHDHPVDHDLSQPERRTGTGRILQQENQKLHDEKSALESAEAQRQSAAAEVPDLRAVANKYFKGVASVNGTADSVSITIQTHEVITAALPLKRMLTELGFSSAVIDRMDKTRALDGTQNADGKNCKVTWTYHPDDGLQMVLGSHSATLSRHGVVLTRTRVSGWAPRPAAPASR